MIWAGLFLFIVCMIVNLSQTLTLLFCEWLHAKSTFLVSVMQHCLFLINYFQRNRSLDLVVVWWLYVAFLMINYHLAHLFIESVELNLIML